MTKYREILRLDSLKISQRQIALSCRCSRNTVAKVLTKAKELSISWPLSKDQTDGQLQKLFFSKENSTVSSKKPPDLEYIHKEMAKHGVTLRLLWTEYCEECRVQKAVPLMYSHFCKYYQDYAQTKRASMHIPRKPGEQTEVDWAGQTLSLYDRDSHKEQPVWIFVGVLSFSQYAYVEAFSNKETENWITAHVHMLEYFSGVTRIIVPDNLRTGVSQADRYAPTINRVYNEMAEFYNTAIIPARVRKPKDKPNVEGAVGFISQQILAALRNKKFFSLVELNKAIRAKLDELNARPFQRKMGSRLSTFLEQEKSKLIPLPAIPFELATWKQATVQFNYHISVEKNLYSVPYEYIKHKVDVRITRNVIEVFYNHTRICSHPRLIGCVGHYSTVEAHMPQDHQEYLSWNADRFISWAQRIGPNTTTTVKGILETHKIEQQGYKSCLGLLKLADKYSVSRLEAACSKALLYTPRPGYKSVKTILSTGQDRIPEDRTAPVKPSEFGLSRSASYYRRENQ